jgi:hypothetical protein
MRANVLSLVAGVLGATVALPSYLGASSATSSIEIDATLLNEARLPKSTPATAPFGFGVTTTTTRLSLDGEPERPVINFQ